MDLDSKIFSCIKNNPLASEDELFELLSSASSEELEILRKLKESIPFINLHTALERYFASVNLVIYKKKFEECAISQFLPHDHIKRLVNENRFPSQAEKDLFTQLMQEIFLFAGRIPKHERIMGTFPYYLEKHFQVIKILFEGDLSIPYVWRYYIAYMAAATHKCEYLMKLEKFYCELFHNSWISADIPEKIQMLGNANVKLAHRPWEFCDKDLKDLLTHWNLNELILALTLMCQFHCLSGFIFGVGISECSDFPSSTYKEPPSPIAKNNKTNLTAILKNYSESTDYEDYLSDSSEDLHGEDEDINYSRIAGGHLSYINYPMDFIARSFNASDFKFSDQAIYILEKVVPEISDSVWNRIRMAFAMTYDTIGQDSGVETAPLRRAIWNYVQRVYGLQYDDYNYTDINRFLKINTKKFIKKVACMPETVNKTDYLNIELDLSHDDMIHLNLLICEARFEAQLVYMLHALQ